MYITSTSTNYINGGLEKFGTKEKRYVKNFIGNTIKKHVGVTDGSRKSKIDNT